MMWKPAVLKDFFRQNDTKGGWSTWLFISLFFFAPSLSANLANKSAVKQFVHEMHQKHGLDKQELRHWFSKVRFDDKVIKAMERPAEAKPWSFYRRHLVSKERIEGGKRFWQQHAKALKKAETEFGVPADIIVAIIGIESYYGKKMGEFPVLQTLATLAFNYPRRAKFFKSELEQFLLLSKERGWDPLAIRGSYCGALGSPQFMPSSYRHYAIDFSAKQESDLIRNAQDAIGSVANFLKSHGWKARESIVHQAKRHHNAPLPKDKSFTQLKPSLSLKRLAELGIYPVTKEIQTHPTPFALLTLENEQGLEHWLGRHNFYVITRYNQSVNYAMAIVELGKEIKALHKRKTLTPKGVQS